MKLYVTPGSPFARLARVVVLEKGLGDRVEVVVATTRVPDSPYYAVNPSGRVPFLVTDDGRGLEDSLLVAAYLDQVDGAPRLRPTDDPAFVYAAFEASVRSAADGIAVWGREARRPVAEQSPSILAHEVARSHRLAATFEALAGGPLFAAPPTVAQLLLACALDYADRAGLRGLVDGRPRLAAWLAGVLARPALVATVPS